MDEFEASYFNCNKCGRDYEGTGITCPDCMDGGKDAAEEAKKIVADEALMKMLTPIIDTLKDAPECQADVVSFLKHFDEFAQKNPKKFRDVLCRLLPAASSVITRAPMYLAKGLGE